MSESSNRLIIAVCASTLTAGFACGHAAPRPSPQVRAAEIERLDRLPEDKRTLDGTWDDVHLQVSYVDGRTQATLELRHPKFRFFNQPSEASDVAANPKTKDAEAKKIDEGQSRSDLSRNVPETLRRMAPFDIDRIEIHDGEVVFVDMTKPARPEIWLSELEVSIENVASRAGMAEGRPVLITARAKVQRSGDLALFVSADPWSETLNFSGRASIEGLATKELYSFLADAAKLQMPKGSLDMYLAFTAKDGHITGGVKPILKNVEVAPAKSGAMARLKAWAADTILSLYSDRVKGRNAVATVVPIHGELEGPKVALWPAIAGVLYNAYLDGLSAGFGGVPAAPVSPARTVAASPPRVTQAEVRRRPGEGRDHGQLTPAGGVAP
jgi:Domain of Unknown Function (DUF748)